MSSKHSKEHVAGETHPPPLTTEQFKASPELRRFKSIMRKLLKVTKAEIDHRVRRAKEVSPRAGNPKAPGRKAGKSVS